ncbi:flagellar basal-body rod protein FlgB [Neorhizobium huautlense]|uniref:Flagellar basal body rod protein FlgB n=1 Tax=Neorhizobium huautlense TaxID=67774 RepID=A0ABT9PTK2_9HYPH|nr:flagellar basal body rod protein FlgB [Neorhizobium huautlense]MDP9837781.1 flagellar basal-body rod protein FlgB [Neorhizobium huautlense]
MQPIQLFALASKQAEWLTVRQEVVATNIANANTPQYRAKDVASFDAVLDNTSMRMSRTNAAHFGDSQLSNNVKVEEAALNDEIGIQESGNTVAISKELSKAGEIKRQYELSANLVKTFNSMMLLTVKR